MNISDFEALLQDAEESGRPLYETYGFVPMLCEMELSENKKEL